MINLKGFVSHIIYRNEENSYTVFEITLTGGNEGTDSSDELMRSDGSDTSDGSDKSAYEAVQENTLTCVGYPVSISEGESCAVSGDFTTHPVYGEQLRLQSYQSIAPETADAIYRYLAAGSIKGIGQALAGRIVKKFGDDTLRIMEEEPEKLARIKGISLRMAREFGAQMEDRKDLRDAMIFLQKYGIGSASAARIWQTYGTDLYTVMKTNPYRLAEDIRGIGFATADEIARKIGIRADSEYRIRSGILYTLFMASGEGHTCLPEDQLIQRTGALLRLPEEEIVIQLENLAVDRRIRILQRRWRDSDVGGDLEPVSGDWVQSGYFPDSENRQQSGYFPDPENRQQSGYFPDSENRQQSGYFPDPENRQKGGCFSDPEKRQQSGDSPDPGEPSAVPEVFLTGVFRREQEIAKMLLDLDARVRKSASVREKGRGGSDDNEPDRKLLKKIEKLEKEEGITLDPLQRQAVVEAEENAILLITGGPGTGKTTTINTIIRFFMQEGLRVLLAAPTGRAARRMSEATGYPAMTIHRMLGVKPVGDGEEDFFLSMEDSAVSSDRAGDSSAVNGKYSFFEHGEDDPLEADVVIIDEMSMVDTNLFHSLLKAVPGGARMILVGDVNQLPSVGPGCVLQDLIDSGAFHTIFLSHVFRQASKSDIVMNAHRILEGGKLSMDNKSRDFFFLERGQAPVIYKHTVQLIREMLPEYVGCRSEDIQVLTPMRRGSLGVMQLNGVLQSVLNPPEEGKKEYESQDTVFREGDKVMQTRNNYQIEWEVRGNFGMPVDRGTGIFNGDFGRIESIDLQSETMTVCFDDSRTVEYPFKELGDLDLAYAITVHKSQGSEYPAVILPVLSGPSGLFNRNLLYTAVTRAKKCVVILGSREGVERMIANTRRAKRYTGLRWRILEMSGNH